ncbi:MAG: 3-carboxy-cis,cis-muconate cycloisomerase [Rhodobacteraceae bacterium]|nr:3-carboxy-cis,cis-muconate cycloisomerase [Paracoccaceae bacterium]
MTPSPFTSALTGALFGDEDVAALLSDTAFVAKMIAVESALARAAAEVGLVERDAAERACAHLSELQVAPEALGAGMASSGVPVPALVRALQDACGQDGDALHWGATSQDIVDCAHMLQWRAVLEVLEERLAATLDALAAASAAGADTLMAGRTRSQIATPITLGLRIATWAQPLIALEAELPALRAQLLRVQFGGASGSGSAVGKSAGALSDALARALGLEAAPCWHLDRSGPQALGGWLVRLTAALGKLARDLITAGRSEIAELQAGTGGGSSTMPQKSNPVAAEAMVTLAQYAAALQPLLAQAAMPSEERDGAAWALEWMALPQMGMAAAAALRHADGLARSLRADTARMRAALEHGNGAAMAETASFALAAHMPRQEAAGCVKAALAAARAADTTLADALANDPCCGPLADWTAQLDPVAAIAAAESMRQRILSRRQAR